MIFYALISAGTLVWCWNTSLKGEGFNDHRGFKHMCMIAIIASSQFVA